MAQPTPYDRQFSFQDFQAQEPTTPLPGDEVDGELNSVKVTIDQTLVNLAKIQRDDGALKNGIVTQDSLSDSLSIGFTYRGSWVSGVNYLISDGASVGSTFYKARSSHLSSGLNQPPNAAFWDPIADFTPLAIGVDSIFTAAIQDGAVTEPKHATGGVSTRALADSGVTEPKHATGGVSTRALADSGVTTAKLADANTTNAKLANMAAQTVKGRATAGSGAPEDLTLAQAKALLAPPSGALFGLTLSNNATDATNDIDIAAGEAASDDVLPVNITLAAAITKRLDAAWAVGSGNGGLDTGSIANTTYHVWLIRRPDTGVVDALFSTSATAPTMPANYTQKRRIGAVLRESGALVAFTQVGDEFIRAVPGALTQTNPGSSEVARTLAVPTGLKLQAIIGGYLEWLTSGSALHRLYSADETDASVTTSNATHRTVASSSIAASFGRISIRTSTAAGIKTRHSASGASDVIYIVTIGWIDTRGRLA